MKKLLIIIILATTLISCSDANKRQEHLKTLYPNCKVEPATGLVQQNGWDFIVIDSTMQIIAVDFYPFSETKIFALRNVR
jgi:hypothetical protein